MNADRETRIRRQLEDPDAEKDLEAIRARRGETIVAPAASSEVPPESLLGEVEFWRGMYDRERARLAKLWVAYRDAEAEVQELRARIGAPAEVHEVAKRVEAVVPSTVVYEAGAEEPYRYGAYTLYRREVTLKNKRHQVIHFFSKKKPKRGEAVPLPEGYKVEVSARTGLPFLMHQGHSLPATKKSYRPQCGALADSGDQCRNSARAGSKYCASHRGYQPKTVQGVLAAADTVPKSSTAEDTLPAYAGRPAEPARIRRGGAAERRQCEAITADGKQCRNLMAAGSKYCASHKGYRPQSIRTILARRDTKPRVAGAADTEPAVRHIVPSR